MSIWGVILGLIGLFAIIAIIVVVFIVVGVVVKGKGRNTQSPKICPQCGKPVKAGINFCTGCGTEIK